jgi:hypothetical protein
MPRVFAPQQPSRFDTSTRLWIPTMNMQPAAKYGELVVLLPPNANRLHTVPLLEALKTGMSDFTKDDWLVAVGDPSLIAAAACIASRKTGGVLRLLKWDRLTSDYIAAEMTI